MGLNRRDGASSIDAAETSTTRAGRDEHPRGLRVPAQRRARFGIGRHATPAIEASARMRVRPGKLFTSAPPPATRRLQLPIRAGTRGSSEDCLVRIRVESGRAHGAPSRSTSSWHSRGRCTGNFRVSYGLGRASCANPRVVATINTASIFRPGDLHVPPAELTAFIARIGGSASPAEPPPADDDQVRARPAMRRGQSQETSMIRMRSAHAREPAESGLRPATDARSNAPSGPVTAITACASRCHA